MSKFKNKLKVAWAAIKRNVFKCFGTVMAVGLATIVVSWDQPVFKIAFMGDPGTGESVQYQVAKFLGEAHSVAIPGDVIYEVGLKNADDPQFVTKFLKPYKALLDAGVVFRIALGNHDYYGNVGAWLEIAKRYPGQIIFPDLFYAERIGGATVDGKVTGGFCLVTLDTEPVANGNEKYIAFQKKWLKDRLAELQDCDFLMAQGHHPLKSSGEHGDADGDIEDFLEDEVAGKFDIYMAGHDHQKSDEGDVKGTRMLISGAGGKSRDLDGDPAVYGDSDAGYALVTWVKGEKKVLVEFKSIKDNQAVVVHTITVNALERQAPPSPPVPPVDVTPAPVPQPDPVPAPPVSGWKKQTLVPFQIYKVDKSTALFLSRLESETKFVNTELDELTPEIAKKAAEIGVDLNAYFCANWEVYRDDIESYPKEGIGNTMGDWPDEKWGNFTVPSVKAFLKKRIDRVAALRIVRPDGSIGGVVSLEIDNTDIYSENNNVGFKVTKPQVIEALTELAEYAHSKGLAIYLKNSGDIAPQLVAVFDGVFNESCLKYKECGDFNGFIKLKKPVDIVEYSKCSGFSGAIVQKKKDYFSPGFDVCD